MTRSLFSSALLLALAAIAVTACAKPVPCPVCYEDEWSREPFPGQQKQHIGAVTPEMIKANHGAIPAEFLGEVSSTTPGMGWW